MNKLRGFTLIEVIIAMLLTLLIFGVGMGAFRIIGQRFDSTHRNASRLEDLYYLESIIKIRMLQSDILIRSGDSTGVFLKESDTTMAIQFSSTGCVLLQNSHIDTVKVDINRINWSYKGLEATEGMVDGLSLGINFETNPMELIFLKQYTATTEMNY